MVVQSGKFVAPVERPRGAGLPAAAVLLGFFQEIQGFSLLSGFDQDLCQVNDGIERQRIERECLLQ